MYDHVVKWLRAGLCLSEHFLILHETSRFSTYTLLLHFFLGVELLPKNFKRKPRRPKETGKDLWTLMGGCREAAKH